MQTEQTDEDGQTVDGDVLMAIFARHLKEQGKQGPDSAQYQNADDELEQIDGIGPVVAARLQAIGIKGIADIAVWSREDAARVGAKLAIEGRIEHEDWIGQARALIANKAIESDER